LKTIEIKTKAHFEAVIGYSIESIETIIAQIDTYYDEFEKKKRDKNNQVIKKRIINPSLYQLRNIQDIIQGKILSKMPMPNIVMGGVKKRDNILNAKIHQGNKYKFATDLKNFFPYISNRMVFNMFIENKFSSEIASLLTKLTTYKGHVPQGAPTSTQIANLVFAKTDRKLMDYCDARAICYTRFVDDLIFSSKSDFQSTAFEIVNIITAYNFHINRKKIFYTQGIAETTGVSIKNNGIETTKAFKLKLREQHTQSQIDGQLMYVKRVQMISKTKVKSLKSILFI
jgi:RNA-directed DNA polymerase